MDLILNLLIIAAFVVVAPLAITIVLRIIQCPDCGQTVGLAEDRRSVWDVLSAHRCEVAS